MAKRKNFTDAQIVSIRNKASKGGSYSEMAKESGCTTNHISAIARGSTYKSVTGPRTDRRPGNKKKRTTAMNGRPLPDFTSLSIDDANRFLQALAMEWPKIRESFLLLDAMIGGQK